MLFLLSTAGAARAQSLEWFPALSASQVYNDNVFFASSDRQGALFSRFDGELALKLSSDALEVSARYGIRAEVYPEPNTSLTTPTALHGGEFSLRDEVTPQLTLTTGATYANSATANEIELTSGITGGRVRTQSLTARGGIGIRTGYRSEIYADYRFSWLNQSSLDAFVHTERLGASWELTRRDKVRLEAIGQQFHVESLSEAAIIPTAVWEHTLGRLTRMTLSAGPRIGTDGVDVDGAATVTYDDRPTRLSLGYSRTHTASAGFLDIFTTDAVNGSAELNPVGKLLVRLVAGGYRSDSEMLTGWAARGNAELDLPLATWLRLFGGYQLTWQRVTPMSPGDVVQHVAIIGLSLVDTTVPERRVR